MPPEEPPALPVAPEAQSQPGSRAIEPPRGDARSLPGLVAITGLALLLRLPHLGARPLHEDESVQAWFLLQLRDEGVYRYDPANYHGPLMYLLALVPTWVLGAGEVALRLPSAILGALIPAALWPMQSLLGRPAFLIAALLVAVAPALVFFSGSFIQEVQLTAFTALLAASLARFTQHPSKGWAALIGVSAAGAFASKETALLTVGTLVIGWTLAAWVGSPGEPSRDLFGGRPRKALLPDLRQALLQHWRQAAAPFAGLLVVLYSVFFTDPLGPLRFLAGFGPWIGYGVTGRNQAKHPFYFWTVLDASVGPYHYVLLPALLAAVRWKHRLGLALTGWATASLLVYSIIPYKTPWCVLQIDLPILLSVGWLVGALAERHRALGHRRIAALCLAAALVPAVLPRYGLLARVRDDDHGRWEIDPPPYVYVQATRKVFELVSDLAGLQVVAGRELRFVHVAPRHPIRWYLLTRGIEGEEWVRRRKKPRAADEDSADGILVKSGSWTPARLGPWSRIEYRLRDGLEATLWIRKTLWAAYQRAGAGEVQPWPIAPVDGRGAAGPVGLEAPDDPPITSSATPAVEGDSDPALPEPGGEPAAGPESDLGEDGEDNANDGQGPAARPMEATPEPAAAPVNPALGHKP